MVEAVDDYFSEELDSSDLDDSDHEPWPTYEKFRKEQLNKDYQFRFNSLLEFKNAMT